MRNLAAALFALVAAPACTESSLELGPGSVPDASIPVEKDAGPAAVRDAGPRDGGDVVELGSSLAAGNGHSCARTPEGTVECWGKNDDGRLGDGTTLERSAPVGVLGLADVVEIQAGTGHTCARIRDGSVRCWGRNDRGALGDGTTDNRSAPVTVRDLTDVEKLSAGAWNTCALLSDRSIRCWGANTYGALGDGTATDRTTPVTVVNLPNAVDLAAGDDFACALGEDGTVRCWGFIFPGGLVGTFAQDGTITGASSPVPIPDLGNDVVAIDAGYGHVCALRADTTVRCWGANTNGQLGDTTRTHRVTPVEVYEATGVVEVDLGGFSCGRWRDGTVQCWGAFGDGAVTFPRLVDGVRDAVEVRVGGGHACARLEDGSVRCWGYNADGQATAGGCCHADLCGIPEGAACGTDGVCTDGWCSGCGGQDQPCCDPLQPEGPCRPDTPLCTSTNVCTACGALGDVCCAGEAPCADAGATCFRDTCVIAGEPGAPCLEGNVCNGGCCVLTEHSTRECVAVDALCPGPEGAPTGACALDGSCGTCGGMSQACCPTDSPRAPFYCSAPSTRCEAEQCVPD